VSVLANQQVCRCVFCISGCIFVCIIVYCIPPFVVTSNNGIVKGHKIKMYVILMQCNLIERVILSWLLWLLYNYNNFCLGQPETEAELAKFNTSRRKKITKLA